MLELLLGTEIVEVVVGFLVEEEEVEMPVRAVIMFVEDSDNAADKERDFEAEETDAAEITTEGEEGGGEDDDRSDNEIEDQIEDDIEDVIEDDENNDDMDTVADIVAVVDDGEDDGAADVTDGACIAVSSFNVEVVEGVEGVEVIEVVEDVEVFEVIDEVEEVEELEEVEEVEEVAEVEEGGIGDVLETSISELDSWLTELLVELSRFVGSAD